MAGTSAKVGVDGGVCVGVLVGVGGGGGLGVAVPGPEKLISQILPSSQVSVIVSTTVGNKQVKDPCILTAGS